MGLPAFDMINIPGNEEKGLGCECYPVLFRRNSPALAAALGNDSVAWFIRPPARPLPTWPTLGAFIRAAPHSKEGL
jgi:hypothetical protein